MIKTTLRECRFALPLFLALTVLTGLAYPLGMTALCKTLFPGQAGGNLVQAPEGGRVSALVGQPFVSERFFHGRPSAGAPTPYNAAASSGSNLGPSNPALKEAVSDRRAAVVAVNGLREAPMDLVTSSASGLDPHIRPESALMQVKRVAKARNLTPDAVRELVERRIEPPLLGFWGEARVNVLLLNLDLERIAERP